MLRLTFILILGLLVGCESLQQIQIASIGAEYYEADLDGFVESDDSSDGTRIDLDDTVDFGKEGDVVYRGSLAIGDVSFDFRYFDFGYSENTTLTENVTLGANVFTAGTTVEGDLDVEMIDIRSQFPLSGLGPVMLEGIIGVEILDASIELQSAGAKSSEGFDQWFPTAGLGAVFQIPFGEDFALVIDGGATLLAWDFFDVEGFYLDAAARAGIKASFLYFGAGYRRTEFDLTERSSDFEMDFVMEGPFIFGELEF